MSDDGYFPRGRSVLRRVMDERIVNLLYGQRALVIGALEPMAFTGTVLHSRATKDLRYYSRLISTAEMFDAVIRGSRADADRAVRRVAGMHQRVNGTLDTDLSPSYPAGTSYSAHDPWLSWFTMAVLADSAHALYTTYVRPLSAVEVEDFHADWNRFGELFGMPPEAAAPHWAGFRDRFDGWLHSDRPHLLDLARSAGLASVLMPLPGVLRGVNDLMYLLVAGTLPDRVRDLYGMSWGLPQRLAHRPLRDAIRAGRFVVPASLRTGATLPVGGPLLRSLEPRVTPVIRRALARSGTPAS
jgi:uncharacterized protein (DUF2236 family)